MTERTQHRGQGSTRSLGVVSGHVLKLIRESLVLTQVGLSDELGVDVTTVQGWETGRRPLTALRAKDLDRVKRIMVSAGARPGAFTILHDAMDADLFISGAVKNDSNVPPNLAFHTLSTMVCRRKQINLITWPITGTIPPQLARITGNGVTPRRGPVPTCPTLSAVEKERFFGHLRALVERSKGSEAARLLHRQAMYLLGFDNSHASSTLLSSHHSSVFANLSRGDGISAWSSLRSSAVALAQNGDQGPVEYFVAKSLVDERQRVANLNYWAYWLEEIPETHSDDASMLYTDPDTWSGKHLINHFLMRLTSDSAYRDLTVTSLWSLILARPYLISSQPTLRTQAQEKFGQVLDSGGLSVRTRRELDGMMYATQLAN